MKVTRRLAVLLILALTAVAGSASAHGGRVGVYYGFGPYWGPWGYPPPWYYQPQVVVVPAPIPPVYIEQREAPAEPATQQYWHYCRSAKGYYPYVKECPDGWQKVLPQPER